jgi:uncharacterized membrane protein
MTSLYTHMPYSIVDGLVGLAIAAGILAVVLWVSRTDD